MPRRSNTLNKTIPFLAVILPLALIPILLAISTQGAYSAPGGSSASPAGQASSASNPVEQVQATAEPGEPEPEGDEPAWRPPSAVELLKAEVDWVPVAPGIDYRKYHLPTPNNVFVARMSRLAENVTLESSIGLGKLSGGKETVQSMTSRYNQALNFWGQSYDPPVMGTRNQVIVAINGSYFDPVSGVPYRGQVQSGWYAKRFTDNENGSGFLWNLHREPLIGGCISHPEGKNILIFIDDAGGFEEEMIINGVNRTHDEEEDELILYTSQYDATTKTEGNDYLEVLVRMDEPDLISASATIEDSSTGTVVDMRYAGSTTIPFDHVVLSARGAAADSLDDYIEVGDTIAISQKVKDKHATEGQCDGEWDQGEKWVDAYAAIGGDYHFLQDGVIYSYSSNGGAWPRHPRTAIAYNDEYIYFIVVDGRDPFVSVGMSIAELGAFAKDTLGAIEGIAQDGGGSSTMVINGEVVNNSYCNNVYCEGKLYVPLLVKPPDSAQTGSEGSLEGAGPFSVTVDEELTHEQAVAVAEANTKLQRLVANGMMMVVVEGPDIDATTFSVGKPVVTTQDVEVRLGPGENYASLGTLPPDSTGQIVDHANGLNGVLAKGSHWWLVSFDSGSQGWVKGEQLAAQSSSGLIPEILWSFR